MKLMQPIASMEIPAGAEWIYEVKYDGFRCILNWDKENEITLTSRNNKDLTSRFPELISFCQKHQKDFQDHLPLTLDGEAAILNTKYQANFDLIQSRGRLRAADKIQHASQQRPAVYMAFDILQLAGIQLTELPLLKRKQKLQDLCFPIPLSCTNSGIYYVQPYTDYKVVWGHIFAQKGEGIIAKRKNGKYVPGKKHHDWFKIKSWRTITGILTAYNIKNDYFDIQAYRDNALIPLGKCKHGLDNTSFASLKKLFLTNGKRHGNAYILPPALCAEIRTLDLINHEIREPSFKQLLPAYQPADCTITNVNLAMAMFPSNLELTNTSKPFWPVPDLTKGDLLIYLRDISPFLLPFLNEHALTLIRCPDGVNGESFFQKHLPDYAPAHNKYGKGKQEELITCHDLDTLLWFGNHGTIEFHTPFQFIGSQNPSEIVFDLDPPDVEHFHLAIKAALLMKELFDELHLLTFVKTSGSKGLQIHIPIPSDSMTFEETAVFTQAIAFTIEQEYPNDFTTQRLKKNRHGRLYIDYVQHGKDKTIIAPYSPRKRPEATVAAPLYWDEVKNGLSPVPFTIKTMIKRVQTIGCPFAGYFAARKRQRVDKILELIHP